MMVHATDHEDTAVTLVNLLAQAICCEFNLDEQTATPLAQRIADGLFRTAGGESVYIPKVDRRRRNARIRLEFNGINADALCRRYGLSRRQLYRILSSSQ